MYFCEKCNYETENQFCWKKHQETKKHNGKKTEYICKCCNYIAKTKQLLDKHLQTKKHKKQEEKNSECQTVKNGNDGKKEEFNDILLKILEKQCETNEKLLEIAKEPKIINNTNTNTNTNSNNNNNTTSFNLNNFLYVDCKDAPNFVDFLKTIQVSLDDIEYLHDEGFVKSYENVIIQKLKEMDQKMRPVHSLDKKRKKIIVKHDNIWNNECFEEKINYSMNLFTMYLMKRYIDWKDLNPTWNNNTETDIFDKSMKIMKEIAYIDKNPNTIKHISNKYSEFEIDKSKNKSMM